MLLLDISDETVFSFTCSYFTWNFKFFETRRIPGPKPVPLFGTALDSFTKVQFWIRLFVLSAQRTCLKCAWGRVRALCCGLLTSLLGLLGRKKNTQMGLKPQSYWSQCWNGQNEICHASYWPKPSMLWPSSYMLHSNAFLCRVCIVQTWIMRENTETSLGYNLCLKLCIWVWACARRGERVTHLNFFPVSENFKAGGLCWLWGIQTSSNLFS